MTAQPDPRGVVIDLGEDHGELPAEGWVPARPRGWRWATERLGSWRLLALLAALALALAAGGAGPVPGAPLRLVARVSVADGASIMVDHDRMMVLGDGRTVTAYSVPGGGRLWRADLGMPAEYGSMSISEGVVLVSRDQEGTGNLSTEAIDEVTGAVLWRSTAQMFVALTGAGAVLMQPNGAAQVQLVSVRTGVPRWSMAIEGCQFSFDQPQVPPIPHAFALLCRDGLLKVVTLPDGTVDAVPLPAYSPDRNAFAPQLTSAGGVMVVERWDGAESTVIEARSWRDGHRLWIRPGFGGQDILFPCDGRICVENQGIGVALEPATGAEAGPPGPSSQCCAPGSVFVPPGTVATVLLVPAGRRAPTPAPPDATVLTTEPERVSHSLQPFLLVQGNRPQAIDRPPQVRLSLVEVVTADGGVRPLQRLPGINATLCTAVASYLICPTAAGQVTVWQYPTD